MSEFLEYLKKYKVLPLDAEGDAEYMTMDIPIEARKTMLSILEDNIFKFGQGVNIDKVGDGNITNVVIKARYAGLDFKANDTEARMKEFMEELFWFCNEYLKITGKGQVDLSKLDVTFNRSMIINEVEIVAKVAVYVADGLAVVVALVDLLFFLLDLPIRNKEVN
jgi:SPP1 family phage portal protein